MPIKKNTGKPAKKAPAASSYATPALEKGLDVIELLAHQPGGLTKSEVARKLNRTISEIFRMLVCLERRGYIHQLEDDRYALSLKLFQLVQEHPPTERLIAEALPIMHAVAHDTHQSCHMGIIEGSRVVILAQVNAPENTGFYVKLGSSVDLMLASSGYVILAHQSPAQRERTLAEWKRETGGKAPADLEKHLARIARQGYEKRASYQVRGVVNISYPIFGASGSAIGALTVPYIERNAKSATTAQVGSALSHAAAAIHAAMGGKVSEK